MHSDTHSDTTAPDFIYGEQDETNDYEDNDLFEVYDIVDSIVPRYDNPTLPAFTFRVLLLGSLSNIIFTIINTAFSFRTNPIDVNPFMAILICYPLGVLMANTLPIRTFTLWKLPFSNSLYPPTFTLNPGPFSVKEHALIFIFASSSSSPAYAICNIIGQKYILNQPLNIVWCLLFVLVCQFYGYGLAGLFRKFLVRPAAMLWPQNLSVIAFINSFHETSHSSIAMDGTLPRKKGEECDGDSMSQDKPGNKLSRFSFFWIAASAMFVWQFVPSFIAPFFSAVSILCLVSVKNDKLKLLGSATQGVGFLSLSFDWSIVSSDGPITSPLWAVANNMLGLWFFLWILVPILWSTNAFGADTMLGSDVANGPNGTGAFPLGYALNSFYLFDGNSSILQLSSLLDPATNTTLDLLVYDSIKPVRMSTLLAVNYASKFLSVTAALVHVGLWYGKDIYNRLKTATRDLDADDIHAQLMDIYPEVPDSWYTAVLVVNTVLALSVCQWGGFDLPWWGVIISTVFAVIVFLPIGVLQAISGQTIGINVVAELIAGYILPGKFVSVITFKSLTYMSVYQGLNLIQALKFGHYVKIPPRDIFWTQMLASFLTTTVNFFTATYIFDSIGDKILAGLEGWNGSQYQTFLTAGAIWGAIGPGRFFGIESPYNPLLYCFLIGAILPLFPWTFHQLGWGGWWYLVNIPLIVTMPDEIGSLHSNMITPLAIGLIVNYFIKRHNFSWWSKYAYIMSAAFDTGTGLAIMVIFCAFKLRDVYMPFHALNRYDLELCSPSYFMTCNEHMISEGSSYNSSADIPECYGFGGMMAYP
ncbi:OPT oligopeptide transporter protein-domain-containing protein [Obelidium mucronatum]|nr:OPT oligopeptide transporter protein-domain-containing protein [Obelidium mucronatum]